MNSEVTWPPTLTNFALFHMNILHPFYFSVGKGNSLKPQTQANHTANKLLLYGKTHSWGCGINILESI